MKGNVKREVCRPKTERIIGCPKCGAVMRLKHSRYGLFYGCIKWPKCDMVHGAHPDGSPLGKPVNSKTRLKRIAAHEAFDRLWKDRGSPMNRNQAYAWLAEKMKGSGLKHIGEMEDKDLRQVISICLERSMMR